ncbi:replicative DNA helicase [Pontibacter sp. G13]|uniref:replicative DNA helicase n=1 Tax=Pontibacter sp. G13 TaxID=3074898 RepID=UPI00288A2F55|nr:replicative DNA helicase [Pontibacter sp. G13]WNJ19502.1 replicative DNA helicase [Pontibacter sp. G13]
MADNYRDSGSYSNPDPGKVRKMASAGLQGGKLPPQALDMEEAVLGALLLEKDALHKIIDTLKPNMFYKDANRDIFEVIINLFQNSEPIDILTVKNALSKEGKLKSSGGAFYLTELSNRVASASNIEYHARVIAEKFILRSLITVSDKVVKDAYEETTDVFELLDRTEQSLFEISETNLRRNYQGMDELVFSTLQRLEEMRGQDGSVVGIPSGINELDKSTAGWHKTDLVIVAARPAMGKTALTLTLARNAALRFDEPVAFFSLEMAATQLVQRMMVSEAELDAQKVRTGNLEDYEWEQLLKRIGSLSKANIFIDDTPGLSIWDLRAKCRRLKAEKGISMVIIDYLQLMTGDSSKGGNREQEIAGISRSLKEIAKELDVVVIALSQLSRAVESRGGDKRPVLSDLRESGSIEQDADMVMFLYRPEYYGFETDDEGNTTVGMAELIIAKQRNGPTGTVKMQFIGKYGKFTDWHQGLGEFDAPALPSGGGAGGTITIPSKMNDDVITPPNTDGSGTAPF